MLIVSNHLYWDVQSCFVLLILWPKDTFNVEIGEETGEKEQKKEEGKKRLRVLVPACVWFFGFLSTLFSSNG